MGARGIAIIEALKTGKMPVAWLVAIIGATITATTGFYHFKEDLKDAKELKTKVDLLEKHVTELESKVDRRRVRD